MITDTRADQAFDWLNDNTGTIGRAKAEQERSKILAKRVRQRLMLKFDGTIAAREAAAEIEPETEAADERYCLAIAEYETLKARQEVETIALDVWRTESANRRRG
jgi:hypothetical protein